MFHQLLLSSEQLTGDLDLFWLWVRVIAFICALGASAFFLSQFAKRKRGRLSKNSSGKIIISDTCALGNRQFLMIAQYGDEKHLLGVSSGSVNHLAKLDRHISTSKFQSHEEGERS